MQESGVMGPWLRGAVLLGSAVSGLLTELILFRLVHPPDATSAVLGGLWISSRTLQLPRWPCSFAETAPPLSCCHTAGSIARG